MNRWGLILVLLFIRLPKLVGVSQQIWINLLPLTPYWYLILRNEIKANHRLSGSSSIIKAGINVLLTLGLVGALLISYVIFFYAFAERVHRLLTLLGVMMMAGLSAMMIGFGFRTHKQTALKAANRLLVAGGIYFLFILIAIFRTSLINPAYFVNFLQLVTLIGFSLSAKSLLNKTDRGEGFLSLILFALNLYVGLNLLLFGLGFTNPTPNYQREFPAVILSFLGISADRVYFPLAEGINAYGMAAGFAAALNGIGLWDELTKQEIKKTRLGYFLAGFLTALVTILMTDSRSALLFSGAAVFLSMVIKQKNLLWFAAGLLILQVAVVTAAPHLDNIMPSGGGLVRENTDLLSGRSVIWNQAQQDLIPFRLKHLVGYGYYGQTMSGVVETYNHLFQTYRNSSQISLHHFLLQTIFDSGYLGAASAVYLMSVFGIRVSFLMPAQDEQKAGMLLGGFLIYILLMGAVSVVPAPYSPELFLILVLIWAELSVPAEKVL